MNMKYLDAEIEGVSVKVGYDFYGENIPATLTDPAEFRELEIESVELNGVEIGNIIKDELFDELINACENDS